MNYDNEKPKILIVDDIPGNILVARTLVHEFGYLYETALSGVEAIDKFKSGIYTGILLDVQMPEMSGFEVAKRIRDYEEKEKRDRTPIIGITAYTISGNREECLASGMDDYISKPYSPDALASALQVHCPF